MTARAFRYKAALRNAEQQLEHVLRNLDSDGINALLKSDQQKEEEDEEDGLDATRILREGTGRSDAGEGVRGFHDAIKGITDAEIPELLAKTGPVRREFDTLHDTLESEAMADEATIDSRHLEIHEDEILGTGSFGEVLGATWQPDGKKRLEKKVAVKRIPARVRGTTEMIEAQENLRREARQWKAWQSSDNNRYIVKLEAMCIKDGQLVVVMEHCDMSLHYLLHEQDEVSLDPGRIDIIMRGIARGIAFLHSKGVIHRDIKPRNVLLSQDTGNAKLCDFGLCTTRFAGATLGATTTVQGSVAYLAPEVLTEPALWSRAADVFAFGVTCWEILHRKEPWSDPGMNRMSVVHAVKNLGERLAFDEDVIAPRWIEHLIASAWSQDARERPTAAKVVAKLDSKRGRSRRSTRVVKSLLRKMTSSWSATSRLPPVPEGASDEDEVRRLVAEDSDDETVAAAALEALGDLLETDNSLIKDDPAAVKALRGVAQSAGAVARCAAVLDLLGDSPRVVAAACKVLWFVGRVDGEREDFFASAEQAGVDRLVLGAMRAHTRRADLQRWACGTLFRLALKVDNKVKLVQLGAAEDILAAMRNHRDSAAVQQYASAALWNLAVDSDNKVKLMRLGAAEEILAAMRNHRDSAAVQENACGALGSLAVNSDNEVKLMRLGAAEEILAAMRNHQDSAAVQEKACGALCNLAWNKGPQRVAIRDQGAGELALEALRRHGSVERAVEIAVKLMAKLAADDKDYFLRMEAKGMHYEMEEAKRRFPSLASLIDDFLKLH
ncbi:Mitogen-activated protein kinase kinase kinase 7 (Transforming growth factor-beta-activated kinase 1) (TGF-beta-activated kinase 1) [Durusdinium trenchii]|uniref:Mitogen-activated protein kinase kinase kinase 7 (Transforming growth factor-beta-activated kinase 1) (TGF-beta-activated kinase 1) n=1 Tax=Durusdinium trenchii TaxID=1381693 RepID=A0ABP0I373_9DINO